MSQVPTNNYLYRATNKATKKTYVGKKKSVYTTWTQALNNDTHFLNHSSCKNEEFYSDMKKYPNDVKFELLMEHHDNTVISFAEKNVLENLNARNNNYLYNSSVPYFDNPNYSDPFYLYREISNYIKSKMAEGKFNSEMKAIEYLNSPRYNPRLEDTDLNEVKRLENKVSSKAMLVGKIDFMELLELELFDRPIMFQNVFDFNTEHSVDIFQIFGGNHTHAMFNNINENQNKNMKWFNDNSIVPVYMIDQETIAMLPRNQVRHFLNTFNKISQKHSTPVHNDEIELFIEDNLKKDDNIDTYFSDLNARIVYEEYGLSNSDFRKICNKISKKEKDEKELNELEKQGAKFLNNKKVEVENEISVLKREYEAKGYHVEVFSHSSPNWAEHCFVNTFKYLGKKPVILINQFTKYNHYKNWVSADKEEFIFKMNLANENFNPRYEIDGLDNIPPYTLIDTMKIQKKSILEPKVKCKNVKKRRIISVSTKKVA